MVAAAMSSMTIRSRQPIQVATLGSLLVLAALAWLLTRERMIGMDAGPGTDPGGIGFYVISWVVMMAAMMFPSIAPMVATFNFVQDRREAHGAISSTVSASVFVAGYLVTWLAFGLLAYGVFVGVRSISIPALSWHRGGPYLAGGILVAAAIYQLTPAKDACLSRCRSPLDFVLHNWRDGNAGALRMGIIHGAWCVGCCWALMASLFALGVMSIPWMIAIAALIALEKLLPQKRLANLLVAGTLLALGIGVMVAPKDVPWLTLPDSPAAARAMQAMGMQTKPMGKSAKPMGTMSKPAKPMNTMGKHGGAAAMHSSKHSSMKGKSSMAAEGR
jgi:predicted metal-binding membrane protein